MTSHSPENRPAGPSDVATELAHERTGVAVERTAWAAERTLMAWVRTALSMISFGFTLGKLGQALQDRSVKGALGLRSFHVADVAYFLVVLGTLSLLAACWQYLVRLRSLRRHGLPREMSLAFVVAILLCLLGGLAFTSLVMNL